MKKISIFILIITLLLITACSTKSSSSETTASNSGQVGEQIEKVDAEEKSKDSTFKFDSKSFSFTSDTFKFTNFKFEKLKDLDDANSLFIFADFTNLDSDEVDPDSIWQQYISISKDKEGTQDALYPTVLPEDLLKDSEYKTAIDNALTSVKKDETITIGYFYRNDNDDVKMTLYDNDRNIVAIINKLN